MSKYSASRATKVQPPLELTPKSGENTGLTSTPGTRQALLPSAGAKKRVQKKSGLALSGLAFWMQRVLEECDRAGMSFAADPVHDLRVALRRCRSMADALKALDPDSSWKQMKRAGKEIFAPLGELRDVQVAQEWLHRLNSPDDPVTIVLLQVLAVREAQFKQDSAQALQAFDRKQWNRWSRDLPRRAVRLRSGSLLFKHLALERWTEAYELHRRALRNRSAVAFHGLRIGLKRFRYVVENFLPEQHASWSGDLKQLQDLLGDVHDLDVLWTTALGLHAFPDDESRLCWRTRIEEERTHRINQYRDRMVGPRSLWASWRADLPQGGQIRTAALARLRTWASFQNADSRHSSHVATLALQLYDGLEKTRRDSKPAFPSEREVLRVAALLHEAGRSDRGNSKRKTLSRDESKRDRAQQKITYGLLRRLKPLLGAPELQVAAIVTRFHRGPLPQLREKALKGLTPAQRKSLVRLAAILRLAAAFDAGRDARIKRLTAENKKDFLLISALGYSSRDPIAQDVASARHLLEIVYRRPVMVKPVLVPRRRSSRSHNAKSSLKPAA
jgi:CHAD domain-containing protein